MLDRHLQLRRLETLYTSFEEAKAALETLENVVDGEVVIAIYEDGEAKKATLGIYTVIGETVNVKVVDMPHLSVASDNNIVLNDDGLFSKAELEYDQLRNTLTFTNTSGESVIPLVGFQIVKSMVYNPLTQTLDITYVDSSGEEKTIPIDLKDLIQENIGTSGVTCEYVEKEGSGFVNRISLKLDDSDGANGMLTVSEDKGLKLGRVWNCGTY